MNVSVMRLESKVDNLTEMLQVAMSKLELLQKSQNVVFDLEENYVGGMKWHLYYRTGKGCKLKALQIFLELWKVTSKLFD